jgi:hypothetical protein
MTTKVNLLSTEIDKSKLNLSRRHEESSQEFLQLQQNLQDAYLQIEEMKESQREEIIQVKKDYKSKIASKLQTLQKENQRLQAELAGILLKIVLETQWITKNQRKPGVSFGSL